MKERTEAPSPDSPILRAYYDWLYGRPGVRDDSPIESRNDIRSGLMRLVRKGRVHPERILDIGSGTQMLELETRILTTANNHNKLRDKYEFFSIDLASIPKQRLYASRRYKNVMHSQANAAALPFPPETFGLIVSCLAIDLAPRESLREAASVLAPEGQFIFALNHPDTVQGILERVENPAVREVMQHIRDNLIFTSEHEIRSVFAEHGLRVHTIALRHDARFVGERPHNTWWLVSGVKAG